MVRFLLRRFIPNFANTSDTAVRERYGILGGILGIVCNIFLFVFKLIIGMLSGSIAIVSDSVNNLSDCGSALVAIFGAVLSNRRPDREHPFGHGRSEYISSLIVAFITIMLGFELLKSSAAKIIAPEPTSLSPVLIAVLCLSIAIKLYMYHFYGYLGRAVNSSVLLASAKDSLSDAAATAAIIIASAAASLLKLPMLDGICGALVSLLIMKTGVSVASDTIGLLLGGPPSPELCAKIRAIVLGGKGICGAHDLIVHDYGPGRAMASIHAEVPADADIVGTHEVIDALERKIAAETGIHTVIHMDPVATDCAATNKIRDEVRAVVRGYDDRLGMHDFRMTDGENRINIIFDIEIPPALISDAAKITAEISQIISAANPKYNCVITVDTVY